MWLQQVCSNMLDFCAHLLVYIYRNEADAVLHTIIAQQAASCKQALADSTAEVEAIMESVAANNVMQLEEANVHRVCHTAPPNPQTVSTLQALSQCCEQDLQQSDATTIH